MSLTGELISIEGIRVYVHRSGKARPGKVPVVLLHGLLFSHWSFRHIIAALLEAGEHVMTFDFPGFGESDRPPPHHYHYDGESFTRVLMGLLDVLDIPKAAIVGHSLGGGVGLIAAATKPDRITRLVLLSPISYRSRLPASYQLVRMPVVGPALFRGAMTRAGFRRLLRDLAYSDPARPLAEDVDFLWERLHRPGGVEAFRAAWRFATDPVDVERSIRAVRQPTLVIWGAQDRLVPSSWARRITSDIPGARSHVLDGAGHAVHEEQPEPVIADLVPFLNLRPPAWA